MQVGLDAENMTIDLMRHGVIAGEVAKKVKAYITERGYGENILFGPAHGCGQMECEYPLVETSSDFLIEQGMVFMVDIFLTNQNMGFRWEDGVIVTDGPPEELSNFKRMVNIL
jgi:Xaa-Pro aminopeptidase